MLIVNKMPTISPFRLNLQSQHTTSTEILTSHSPVDIFGKFDHHFECGYAIQIYIFTFNVLI